MTVNDDNDDNKNNNDDDYDDNGNIVTTIYMLTKKKIATLDKTESKIGKLPNVQKSFQKENDTVN